MPHPTQQAKVILRHCEGYDVAKIRQIIREGMDELGVSPRGRTLVKPNGVAAGPLFEHAHTRVEFLEGTMLALQDKAGGAMTELALGERCGITIPTRFVFGEAGYSKMLKRNKLKHYYFEESPQVEVALTHEGRLRDYFFTPEPVAKADFFVNCPKFKAHPWTTVTFSMKNYIGIQDDRHRLIDHDHALNKKVRDLQYIIQPQFIAIDAIIAGEGRMLTPIPRTMNMIVLGNNQVAIDSVCSRIIGLDPMEIEHIRLAYEDGFGPVAMDEIAVSGDLPFEEAQHRAKGFQVGLVRVEKYFEGTAIQAYAGPYPGGKDDDYCWGGCPGVIEEVIEILRLFDPQCDAKLPRIHLVFGDYKGPLDIRYGEKVVFIGDCTTWEGNIGDQLVQIGSKYKDRSLTDPHDAEHQDIYLKMANMANQLRKAKNSSYIRLGGCPVSVAELVFLLSELGGIKNPVFDVRYALGFNRSYAAWRAVTAFQRLRGIPYQIRGAAERGEAKPNVTPRRLASPDTPDAEE